MLIRGASQAMKKWITEIKLSYNLNSLNGVVSGDYVGDVLGLIQGDTRSLDYSSYEESERNYYIGIHSTLAEHQVVW